MQADFGGQAVPHHHQPTAATHLLQPGDAAHLSHAFYGDMARASQTPPASSDASPRFSAISPTSQPKQLTAGFAPDDRAAPSRNVSDETIDDAYAGFILYCNPNFPTSIDTTELVKLFRIPPKSDGNSFSTWTLFELIRKYDAKEIKTWTQLALDLGVKSPRYRQGPEHTEGPTVLGQVKGMCTDQRKLVCQCLSEDYKPLFQPLSTMAGMTSRTRLC